jgi:hypothetical protein
MLKHIALAVLVSVAVAGGTLLVTLFSIDQRDKEVEADPLRYAPTGATNYRPIGNGWATYECEVAGKKRKFMVYRIGRSHYQTVELGE